jgi:hypothetical protein
MAISGVTSIVILSLRPFFSRYQLEYASTLILVFEALENIYHRDDLFFITALVG